MNERVRPTRSGLFTIELLVAVGVFTLCAAICVGLFVRSEVISRDSADLNRAVTEAQRVAECFKAAGGNLSRTAELCDCVLEETVLTILYDADWKRLDGDEEEVFRLELEAKEQKGFISAELSIARTGETEQLLSWPVAAWPVVGEAAS